MKDTITKHYPNLTGRERFQLALKAAAEGNEAETERLVKTCPKKNYRMNEAAFLDRMEAAITLTMAFSLDLAEHHGRLQLLVAVEKFLPCIVEETMLQGYIGMDRCYEAGWLAAGGKGKPPGMDEKEDFSLEEELQVLVKIRKALQGQVKALWEAFSVVCREDMGLEPETPLAAFYPPVLEWLETDLTEDTVVNGDTKAKSLALMREYWRKLIQE